MVASDLKLEELEVKNGSLSTLFDPLNNEYTILLGKEEYNVHFSYKVAENVEVLVENNYDLENNSVVTIFLSDTKSRVEYHFQILKEESDEVAVFEEITPPENSGFLYTYKNYVIPSSCFFLIGFVFKILFKHKK